MKRQIWKVLSLLACGLFAVGVAACNQNPSGTDSLQESSSTPEGEIPHEHTYTVSVVSPDEGKDGCLVYTCQSCGEIYNKTISASVGLSYSVNLDNKTCTVTGMGDCTDTEIHIPETLGGYTVTAIGEKTFFGCLSLKKVDFPTVNSLTEIGAYAFSGCAMLKEIDLPSKVTTLKEGAFENCIALERVCLPRSLTTVETHVFYSCSKLAAVSYLGTAAEYAGISIVSSGNSVLETIEIAFRDTAS